MSFLPAIFDHGERKRAFFLAQGAKEKWTTGLKWILINWGLPILAITVTIAQGVESVSMDKKVDDLSLQLTNATFHLASAESDLLTTKSDLAVVTSNLSVTASNVETSISSLVQRVESSRADAPLVFVNLWAALSRLGKFKGARVAISSVDDTDAQRVADQIAIVLTHAEWVVLTNTPPDEPSRLRKTLRRGVTMEVRGPGPTGNTGIWMSWSNANIAARALQEELNRGTISTAITTVRDDAVMFGQFLSLGVVYVRVGPMK